MINIKSKGDELLETRLNEATNPLNSTMNLVATEAFCEQILKEPEGCQIAVRLLAHKMQSPQEKESLYSFAVIDECVKKCGSLFHREIGKFRFLNELIKVISPKYLAPNMSSKVKTRCIECLYGLYKGIPHEAKLAEAYLMLKRERIITEDPTYMDDKIFKVTDPESERAKSIFETSKDAERLSVLLKSRKPEDLKEANRIIKTVVLADNNRVEQMSKREMNIETMKRNTGLLRDMLSRFQCDDVTSDDLSAMKEIVEGLEATRSEMFQLSRLLDTEELSNNLVAVIADSDLVVTEYKEKTVLKTVDEDKEKHTEPLKVIIESLLLGDVRECDLPSSDLQSISIPDTTPVPLGPTTTSSTLTTKYDVLMNLFQCENSMDVRSAMNGQCKTMNGSLANGHQSHIDYHVTKENSVPNRTERIDYKGFEDLDILSKELFNLGKKNHEQDVVSNSSQDIGSNYSQDVDMLSSVEDKPVHDSLSNNAPFQCNDSAVVSVTDVQTHSVDPLQMSNHATVDTDMGHLPHHSPLSTEQSDVADLSSFVVPLSDIKPHTHKIPVVIYDNEDTLVKVTLYFAHDRPHPNVSVIVAQISTEGNYPVTDIVLKFGVSKPMRLRKQKSSTNTLSAHSPFTPSVPINEIVLIYHPSELVVDLKYQLSYDINGESFLESSTTGAIDLE